ncbi:M57 family metalloprotease [Roseivirga sp. BDSF3-8]|uniref:M57 family metalloprotease n=1 Tax=Roseivirga sp. BDSF3-8 TaxID=3241598 RepID=UPI00353247D0
MKTTRRITLVMVLSLFAFWSCNEDPSLEPVHQTDPVDISAEMIQKIKDAGVSVEGLQEFDDYYIAEGDIIFHKEDLKQDHGPSTEQARSDYIIAPAYWNIKVYLDDASFSSLNLSNAVNDAISSVNGIGSGISMSRVYSASQANITIRRSNLSSGICGIAGFPTSSGRPYSLVNINESYMIQRGYTSDSRLTQLVAHELGHCIGLRHTDWSSRNEPFANTIAGTPTSDSNSVMNSTICGLSWVGWSFYDKVGVKTLYATQANAGNNLVPGEQLSTNQFIQSNDNRFKVVMQSDGNFVLYKYNVPIWSSNTGGTSATKAIMQGDGNLVVYDNSFNDYWDSGTNNRHNAFAVIQDDGNFVIYQGGTAFWDSGTAGY